MQTDDGLAPLHRNTARAAAGEGRGAGASAELNRATIPEPEKHLRLRAAGTSGAILYPPQPVSLISCTANTQRNTTPSPPLARFLPPLPRFLAKRGPEKNQQEGASVQVKPGQVGKASPALSSPLGGKQRASRGLSHLPGAALGPSANGAARGSRPAGARCSFYVKSPSSSNRWPVSHCQGYSADPAQPPGSSSSSPAPAASGLLLGPGQGLSRSRDEHRTSTDASRGFLQQKHQAPTCGCSGGKAEPSTPRRLPRGRARRAIKDVASASSKCLTLAKQTPRLF